MNIKTLWTDQRARTLFVPLTLATLPWGQWGSRPLTFAVYATLVAAYYIGAREQMDELKHRLKGDYDQPGDRNVTPRVDKVGDSLGPAAVAATAWVGWILGLAG